MGMFVVLKMRLWEDLEVEEGIHFVVNFVPPEGCIGFLPVFSDKEKAAEFAENEGLVEGITEA